MIILNIAKELIKVANWAEIIERPGFTSDLDPVTHKLQSIIGRYVEPDRKRCGLSNCHTPHAKGYIVVTTDGRETNIGKDCGKTYFGVDFETMTRQFERDVTEKENRETLFTFSFRIDELKARISDLRKQEGGADWAYKLTRPLVESGRGCPGIVVRRLAAMVKTRNPLLTIAREATPREAEDMEAAQGRRLPRPQYVDEPLAEVTGMEALYPESDLRTLLVIEIEEPLKQFESEDIDTMTYESLRRWARWVNTVIDPTLDRASAAVAHGRRLLTIENLEPLARLLDQDDDTAQFGKYLKTLRA